MGAHSTIDKPEPVNRVRPPRMTIANTSPQQISSHVATRPSAACAPGRHGSALLLPVIIFARHARLHVRRGARHYIYGFKRHVFFAIRTNFISP